MKIKHFLLVALFITTSYEAFCKKLILPIELVATQADIIVIGEIISVANNSYEFQVTKEIKGEGKSQITVQQFEEWTCDTRFSKVEIGQKLFLFLKKKNTKLEIINGSTGEIPIIDNYITLNSEEYKHVDYKWNPYKLELSEFTIGITNFIKCFGMLSDCDSCFPDTLQQKCSNKDLKIISSTNKFFEWIYKKVKNKYKLVKT